MYHSNGNYEAFMDARKPEGAEKKSAYIVGGGLAGLAAAVFMIRDAHMEGKKIHVLEEEPVADGYLDRTNRPGAIWKITLNVCGTCIGRFLRWRFPEHLTSMSMPGLIRMIQILRTVA